jgi:16S rRNA (cytosine1402-N4)-methyltransferase
MFNYSHQPVLLSETLELLVIDPAGFYIDATFGRGGHSRAILKSLSSEGRLLAFDQDPEAVAFAKQDKEFHDPRFQIVHASFSHLLEQVSLLDWQGKVSGILMDLGVSSPQLDTSERGFSFLREGPLDMRMNPSAGIDAARWLSQVGEKELADVLWQYGEERYSRRIARAIVTERKIHPITTTTQLAEIISKAHPRWEKHKHPATRSFQAIRIFINHELEELETVLSQSLDTLKIGGRLLAITFHSLEDRIVKRFLQQHSGHSSIPRGLPLKADEMGIRCRRVCGPVRPNETEIAQNPRARSATLRVMEKLA